MKVGTVGSMGALVRMGSHDNSIVSGGTEDRKTELYERMRRTECHAMW
jgi:hypothetical protein